MRRFAMGDVSVADMAAAREARAMRQQRLLMQRGALVCLTMNIPGPHKTSPLIAIAFEEGKRLIAQTLPGAAWRMSSGTRRALKPIIRRRTIH